MRELFCKYLFIEKGMELYWLWHRLQIGAGRSSFIGLKVKKITL